MQLRIFTTSITMYVCPVGDYESILGPIGTPTPNTHHETSRRGWLTTPRLGSIIIYWSTVDLSGLPFQMYLRDSQIYKHLEGGQVGYFQCGCRDANQY